MKTERIEGNLWRVTFDDGHSENFAIRDDETIEEAIINAENAVDISPSYQELRYRAYPKVGDQLDALWEGGQKQADMKATIDAIKVKYPKE